MGGNRPVRFKGLILDGQSELKDNEGSGLIRPFQRKRARSSLSPMFPSSRLQSNDCSFSRSDFGTFENKAGLADDMKFLACMPELCDVTFLVGDTREPVCAVKSVLGARSR